ncbi:MAG: metallophosphoesterase family protein [Thermoplasmata archaeon]
MSRVLVISDIHSNYDALESVLLENFDYLLISGDLVDYGPEPHKVIDEIKDKSDFIVIGNHDSANAFNIDCRCSEKFHDLSVYTRNFYKRLISNDQIKFLRSLPLFKNFEIDGVRFTMVHASMTDYLYDYVLPTIGDEDLVKKFKNSESDFVIFGHTHLPMVRRIKSTVYVNPGSVGQPRDGDWRTSYAIIDTNEKSYFIKRIKYDLETTVQKINSMDMEINKKETLIKILRKGESP